MTRATRVVAALAACFAAQAQAVAAQPAIAAARGPTVRFQIDSVPGVPGEVAEVAATLLADGAAVTSARLTLQFDSALIAVPPRLNQRPDCAVNPDIEKDGTSFVFLPGQCDPAAGACTGIRAFVFTTGNVYPIPDGAELFRCRVSVAVTVGVGPIPIRCTEASANDPDGVSLDVACADGSIVIGPSPAPTDSPSPGPTRTPTPPRCVGDCARTGAVTIADLVRAVNVALGNRPPAECAAADADGDLMVAIHELIAAVDNALDGCPEVTH